MKIVFNDITGIEEGSSRLHVYNLHHWLSKLGYDVHLNDWNHYSDYDIVCFGKSVKVEEIIKAKAQNPKLICGSINPSDYTSKKRKILKKSDFFIVASITEREYYCQYNKNVFFVPQIERLFNKVKKHEDHEPIVLGYHGNFDHLTQFHPYLKPALEILAKEFRIKLIVVSSRKPLKFWRVGRPDIEIAGVPWTLDTFEEQLLRCDIGLVPGLTPITSREKNLIFKFLKLKQRGITSYTDDYLLRFKNNTNSGRTFVFHQLGIPVVSDYLPTSFHILADPRCGYLAHSTEGWLFALRNLCKSADHRQKIAQNALKEFNRLYDPLEWSKRLYQDIENLWRRFRVR
jgi:hypothetical protein